MDNFQTPTASTNLDRSANTLKVDNLLRRVLKVSDPSNANEVSRALLDRYADQANALQNERTGFPVVLRPQFQPTTPVVAVSFGPEVTQALDDVNRDLQALVENSQLKDVRPELGGWARSIRSAAADGLAAARFSLDPRQRDRAFAARRQLGDYARLSRYVGALTPDIGSLYRRLAQSCDILAGLMLVLVGDGLAASGITRGTLILTVSPSDLLERRDAAIMALRTLVGTSAQSYGQNDWPRGLEAYRRLLDQMDSGGMSELRGLFHEPTLARTLDEVIDLSSSTTPDGLRGLGSQAIITAQRLQRLISVAQAALRTATTGGRRIVPESPPLASFLSALSLFAQAFDSPGTMSRLLYIARPPIIFYGLFGQGGPDFATRRLLSLVQLRGRLAELVDCFMECDCTLVGCQLILDKIVFDVDRAIDLYALGIHPLAQGDPERRAGAYGALIDTFSAVYTAPNSFSGPVPCLAGRNELLDVLFNVERELGWPNVVGDLSNRIPERTRVARLLHSELCLQSAGEQRWIQLVATLAPACRQQYIENASPIEPLIGLTVQAIQGLAPEANLGPCPPFDVNIPPSIETSLDTIANDILADGL
jgi:hypothetical protein